MLFIFDWDGTLCNSLEKIVHSTQSAARDVQLPVPTPAAVKEIVGLSLSNAIEQIFPNISRRQFEGMVEAYRFHFNNPSEHQMHFFPGVRETLDTLREAGHQLSIATGKSRQGLERILDEMALADYFHGSRCADETASKPDPRMLRELLAEFATEPEQAVMVGDTEYDMAMAQSIDMPRMAVSYGAHAIERLRVFDPVLCLDEFPHLLEWQTPQ